jgi:hypothetical protein
LAESGKLWLVVNSASGSNDPAAVEALVEALGAAEASPARVIDGSSDDLPTRTDLDGAGVATLAIYTGDGTINALVPKLEGWDGAVLVLPGGTANLLAKALHGDAAVEAIVEAFGAGRLTLLQRPCIHFGEHTALIEVLAGPGAAWSDVREELRDGDLGTIASTTVEAVRQSAAGPMVAVIEPALGRNEGYAGVRLSPAVDGMQVDGYASDGFGDYLKQGLALLKRDFREGPHDELGHHPAVTCRSADGSEIALMVDGERLSGASEQRFSLETLHVNLLAHRDG